MVHFAFSILFQFCENRVQNIIFEHERKVCVRKNQNIKGQTQKVLEFSEATVGHGQKNGKN